MFSKLERHIAILLVLIVGVFSIGMTTTLLEVANAQEQKFTASLSGSQEVPPNTSTAKGWAWFKPMGDTVWYKVNVTGVDKVSMAHIHSGKTGANGDPIAMLQIEKSTGPINGTLAQGNITSSDLMGTLAGKSISDLVSKMQSGETYVNVHTESNPNGEIRGQISSMANNVTSETPSVGDDTSSGTVKTFVNETGRFLTNIPAETNELLSGESESAENDTVGK
jgi:hypothetical protein